MFVRETGKDFKVNFEIAERQQNAAAVER